MFPEFKKDENAKTQPTFIDSVFDNLEYHEEIYDEVIMTISENPFFYEIDSCTFYDEKVISTSYGGIQKDDNLLRKELDAAKKYNKLQVCFIEESEIDPSNN